ncbi:hypothetical protein Q5M85_13915 [Paraclostridium bifermentans]|nr:hypothetical protein [Paraclostridium bifermentans]
MAGLYGTMYFITNDNGSDIGSPELQSLGNYDMDLNYTGVNNSKIRVFHKKILKKITSIKGVDSIYTFATEFGYTKLNTDDHLIVSEKVYQ